MVRNSLDGFLDAQSAIVVQAVGPATKAGQCGLSVGLTFPHKLSSVHLDHIASPSKLIPHRSFTLRWPASSHYSLQSI